MKPYQHAFLAVLVKRPLKALQIAWWWVTRRRVRAFGHLRAAVAQLPVSYRLWIAIDKFENRAPALAPERGADRPPLAVHIHLASGQGARSAIRSVIGQSFPHWELYITSERYPVSGLVDDPRIHAAPFAIATPAGGLAHVLKVTRASHVVPLAADSTLTPDALLAYADAILEDPVPVLYADQDERDSRGRRSRPWFKPQWDQDLFLAQDYLSSACVIPVDAARQVAEGPDGSTELTLPALLLRLLSGPDALPARHVLAVAVTTPGGAWSAPSPDRAELVHAVLGMPVSPGPFGTLVLHRPLPDPPPRVSVIVPTRDRIDLLRPCVEGLLQGTDYPDIELIIADNGSIEPDTLAFFERCRRDRRVRVVHWPHPYNYSAINNFAVAQASGAYICLLNNDTEVIDASWLSRMVAHAVRPEVGAVGARLLYPDRSVQHAGVVIGMGNAAGHAHRGLRDGDPGWFAQALVTRSATAVTAACLVVAKDKFDAVSGFDEENLAIAYNDVDLCLKLRAAGWRNIYVAQAVLIHHESKSRGLDFAPEQLARYTRELAVLQERWETIGFCDPTHHSQLDPASETYRLKL